MGIPWNLVISRRHEKDIEDLWPYSKRTSASGAKDEKGDLQTKRISGIEFCVECKSTINSSYSLSKKVWNTVKSHAENKSYLMRPAMAIRLYGKKVQETSWGTKEYTGDNVPVELDLVVLDLNDFIEFYEDYLRLKEQE